MFVSLVADSAHRMGSDFKSARAFRGKFLDDHTGYEVAIEADHGLEPIHLGHDRGQALAAKKQPKFGSPHMTRSAVFGKSISRSSK
jgi:hypothetical protein